MAKQIIVILGSARNESDTRQLVASVFPEEEILLLDLLDYSIAPYNYEAVYPANDNFLDLIQIILDHKIVIFATPVYWYAMSAGLKNFFDRFTDLCTTQKATGRKLAGKVTALLAIGFDQELPPGFAVPFRLTSEYFNMNFREQLYYSKKYLVEEEQFQNLRNKFISGLNSAIKK